MGAITIEDLTVRFGDRKALASVNLQIKEGEFFVILGPSGAGKTTLLKTIAGLIPPSEGRVLFGDNDVTGMPPEKRNIAMTFEQYALYPNYSVMGNIAHPLRAPGSKLEKHKVLDRVNKISKMLRIDHLLDRLPRELSGGQKQRVALARAMVREPYAFLLDEPLSHVDAQIRQQMRVELNRLQVEVSNTSVYVTHDYQEALALGDRVAIINSGKIVQVGTGEEVYYHPRNEFVARLVGQPQINIIPARVFNREDKIYLDVLDGMMQIEPPAGIVRKICEQEIEEVNVGIRAQFITLEDGPGREGSVWLDGKVYIYEPFVTYGILTVNVKQHQLFILTAPDGDFEIDRPVRLGLEISELIYFNSITGDNLEGTGA
ncbi:MAG: ABC transporter ATP-binding protein [Firmicutes bacterium HGW-Firmicutes-14]|nr:MAG: ABC transporter ATP-binding protein [Firmicutes bacterium HGW-Firmicutes-14]